MLFHTLEAWNLAYAIYDDHKIGAESNGFVQRRFDEGFSRGWIRPERSREALEMFLLSATPLLPPDLDIDTRVKQYGLRWADSVAPDLVGGPMGRYCLPEFRALKGLILSNLAYRGSPVESSQFDEMLTTWENLPKQTRWAHTDPLGAKIESEFNMVS